MKLLSILIIIILGACSAPKRMSSDGDVTLNIITVKDNSFIRGSVECNVTGYCKEPIEGATVYLHNRKDSSFTGTSSKGKCSFYISPGIYTATVTSIGYNPVKIENVRVDTNHLVVLDIAMTVSVGVLYDAKKKKY